MKRVMTAALFVAAVAAGTSSAFAQDAKSATEGRAVVTIIPGGATFLTEGKNSTGPSFGNYSLGGAVVGNFNKYVGVEGEEIALTEPEEEVAPVIDLMAALKASVAAARGEDEEPKRAPAKRKAASGSKSRSKARS